MKGVRKASPPSNDTDESKTSSGCCTGANVGAAVATAGGAVVSGLANGAIVAAVVGEATVACRWRTGTTPV